MAPSENTWLTWKSSECPNCLRQIMILTLMRVYMICTRFLSGPSELNIKIFLLIVIKWKGKYVGFWKNRESAKMEKMLCKLFHLKVIRVLRGLWAPENNHYQETQTNVFKQVLKFQETLFGNHEELSVISWNRMADVVVVQAVLAKKLKENIFLSERTLFYRNCNVCHILCAF